MLLKYQRNASLRDSILMIFLLIVSHSAAGAGTAVKLVPPKFIELQIIGEQVSSTDGESMTIPSAATAVSLNITVVNTSAAGFVTVWPCGVDRPVSSNLNFVRGSIVPNGVIASLGSNGSVCFYASSETDIIVDVAGWFEGAAFSGATPERLLDTRNATQGPAGRLTPAAPISITMTNLSLNDSLGGATGIPADINAVSLTVTVVGPSGNGFITVYPCDVDRPLSSNVNYSSGQIIANGVIAPVSADGRVCFYSSAPTDLIVDLAGWFGITANDTFTGATPLRYIDTRDGTGGQSEKLDSAVPLVVPIWGENLVVNGVSREIPTDAKAASLNVTVVNPERSGFATVWPCSAAQPVASNLNFGVGQVVANNVVAPIGDSGFICIYSNVATDVIVDVSGYFSGVDGNTFIGITPKRFVDTREGPGPAPGGGPEEPDEPIPTAVALGGLWRGTIRTEAGDGLFVGITTDDGRFRFLGESSQAHFRGTLDVSSNDLTGSGSAVLNGEDLLSITLSGQITERETITGTWSSGSDSGAIDFQYWDIHERNSAAAKLDGFWTAVEAGQTWLELDISNGQITGTDFFNCDHVGTISSLDPDWNVYLVQDTITNCVISGDYIGLGLIKDVFGTNDGFMFGVDNGKFYITGTLIRR